MSSIPTRLSRSATLRPPRLPSPQHESERPYSSSPTSSAESSINKSEAEDQFIFSPQRTPSRECASFFAPSHSHSRGPSSLANYSAAGSGHPSVENPSQQPRGFPFKSSAIDSPTSHSKPIAIELPPSVSRKIAASSVYTPIEPLSGRGDIKGGYFPFHEDPDKRITRPHPFHTDSQGAQSSLELDGQRLQGSVQSSDTTSHPSSVLQAVNSESRAQFSKMNSVKMPSSQGNTPVTSYVPSGLHDVPMPVGKYYPSNYEAARSRQSNGQITSHASRDLRSPSPGGPAYARSETVVPQFDRQDSSRSRSDSDAKRRLQQYQRDMVAQATQAARQLSRTKGVASLAAAHGVPVQKFQTGSHKPVSPRLQPLGSPGPVTPMELEGQAGDGGYLTRGRPVPSPDARRDNKAVARALEAEEARKRREGRGSPTVQAGGFGF